MDQVGGGVGRQAENIQHEVVSFMSSLLKSYV